MGGLGGTAEVYRQILGEHPHVHSRDPRSQELLSFCFLLGKIDLSHGHDE